MGLFEQKEIVCSACRFFISRDSGCIFLNAAYRHLRHNIRYGNAQGIFSVLSLNLYNPFIPILAIKVFHASDQQIAWLSSFPAITGILALIPGAIFLDRLESKKLITTYTVFAARIFIFTIGMLPFLHSNNPAFWLVILVALMNFPAPVGTLFWQALFGNITPSLERAKVLAFRNRITTGVGLFATLATGVVISQFPEDLASPYQLFCFLAFVAGMFEVYYLFRLKEVKDTASSAEHPKEGFLELLKLVWQEKRFVYFLLASVLFHFGWQMAWPLFNIYQVDARYVNMNAFWLSIATVINSVAQMIAFGWWGRKADRYGNGLMLMISGLGMALNPFLYMVTKDVWAVLAINALIGLFVAGFVQTLFNRQLDLVHPEHRAFFLAIHAWIVGVSNIFAPMVGVAIYKATTMNTGFFVSGTIRTLGALAYGLVMFWETRQLLSNKTKTPFNF